MSFTRRQVPTSEVTPYIQQKRHMAPQMESHRPFPAHAQREFPCAARLTTIALPYVYVQGLPQLQLHPHAHVRNYTGATNPGHAHRPVAMAVSRCAKHLRPSDLA